ncbi:MAG: KdsC family phosphatase [bacterium]|jgi:3-deoxy-D-manno-octulosonate 8-phosphate phosphatase (KDO 8-P phosphatase)
MQLLDKFKQIRLIVFDMDGVLTNGKLLLLSTDQWIREMDIKDGFALQLAVKSGLIIAVITGSSSEPVKSRLSMLGVDRFYDRIVSKGEKIVELMDDLQLSKHEVLFMGDDIPDLEVFQHVGIRSCPADAAIDLKNEADYISPNNGGNGCVRDVLEKVLRVQGKWIESVRVQSI